MLFITNAGMTVRAQGAGDVSIALVGARRGSSRARGEEELASKTNYFLGSDPGRWRSNVANYARVRAKDCLPGVDLVWHGGPSGIEYDLELASAARVTEVAFDVDGGSPAINARGDLEVSTPGGVLVQKAPRVTQQGDEPVARYRLVGPHRVALDVQAYDASSAMLIDPEITYSTYLGGSGADSAVGIALDSSGNRYVLGNTTSTNFPTKSPLQGANAGGGGEVFVSMFNPSGSALLYSTYLGGSGYDEGRAIAVDASGDAYVTGFTLSTDFPTQSPLQSTNASGSSGQDAFISKLNPAGSALVYSTYLGGTGFDEGRGIAVDGAGNAYVAGWTSSLSTFPTKNALQATNHGIDDAFVSKLNASGSALVYSTYLGGSVLDQAQSIALDASGNAYVTGNTSSSDFPTQTPFQAANAGGSDVFVSKLNASGSAITYSTYLGGSGDDTGNGIVVDGTGAAYITGQTSSNANFPTQNALQPKCGSGMGAGDDAFVTKLDASGTTLVYSTYLGGATEDVGTSIAVDGIGNAYVAGYTNSFTFPTYNASQGAFGGGASDAFVSKVNSAGSALAYSTFLGGTGDDRSAGIVLDGKNDAHLAGTTTSTDFPIKNALQATAGGSSDVFVTQLHELGLGAPCTANECGSGHCVDGVCCDTACSGQCEACDVTGHEGTCTPVVGAPHGTAGDAGARQVCGDSLACGACDGTNVAVCTYATAGAVCSSTCNGGVETDSVCDGKGHCAVGPSHSCSNLVCTADGGACKPSCANDLDCVSGFTCEDGGCVVGATCVDDHTAQPPSGPSENCTPYKCRNGCLTSCTSVDDCVSPNVCSPGGQCVPPATASSGCNCDTTSGSTRAPLGALLAVAAAWLRRRHRLVSVARMRARI